MTIDTSSIRWFGEIRFKARIVFEGEGALNMQRTGELWCNLNPMGRGDWDLLSSFGVSYGNQIYCHTLSQLLTLHGLLDNSVELPITLGDTESNGFVNHGISLRAIPDSRRAQLLFILNNKAWCGAEIYPIPSYITAHFIKPITKLLREVAPILLAEGDTSL